MTDFEAQVLSDLSALKSQMNALIGIGQPGRLSLLEARVDQHGRTVQRMKGVGGGLSVLLTLLHVCLDFVKR